MSSMIIPHNAFIFVGDGQKALVLRNDGDAQYLNLKTEEVFTDRNPLTHDQGTDRPGRSHSSVGSGRFSVIQTDWHTLEEHRFAHEVAAALEKVVRERGVQSLFIIAPPRALADLRKAFTPDVKKRIVAEINKDLTKHPLDDIENHLANA
jgi:protein required for attachment to host cells